MLSLQIDELVSVRMNVLKQIYAYFIYVVAINLTSIICNGSFVESTTLESKTYYHEAIRYIKKSFTKKKTKNNQINFA